MWCRLPGSEGAKGIGAVVVDLDRPGVSLTGVHHTMGLRATTEAELAFDDVEIGPDDVLIAGDPTNSESFKRCSPTSTTSAAATRRCASAPRRARSSTRSGT